mgnify:CR=1 FL=1
MSEPQKHPIPRAIKLTVAVLGIEVLAPAYWAIGELVSIFSGKAPVPMALALGEGAEALDELRLDAQHAPRVGVHPVARAAGVEQPLVGGGRGDLGAPQRHRALRAQGLVGLGARGSAVGRRGG